MKQLRTKRLLQYEMGWKVRATWKNQRLYRPKLYAYIEEKSYLSLKNLFRQIIIGVNKSHFTYFNELNVKIEPRNILFLCWVTCYYDLCLARCYRDWAFRFFTLTVNPCMVYIIYDYISCIWFIIIYDPCVFCGRTWVFFCGMIKLNIANVYIKLILSFDFYNNEEVL